MVKDTTPIQVSHHGKVIVDAIPDPLSNERGVFAFIASDGETIHNLRADTKLRVTAHPCAKRRNDHGRGVVGDG